MPFTCPFCGRVSHNPNDLAQNYCGHCHVFIDDVVAEAELRALQARADEEKKRKKKRRK